jgi:hypothetical protein
VRSSVGNVADNAVRHSMPLSFDGSLQMKPMRLLAAWLALASATLVAGSSSAAASVVYDWQGTCTLGCTGTATGSLTLTGGTPTTFTKSQFVSFEFTSSSGGAFFLDNTSPYLNAQGGALGGGSSWRKMPSGLTPCRSGSLHRKTPRCQHLHNRRTLVYGSSYTAPIFTSA